MMRLALAAVVVASLARPAAADKAAPPKLFQTLAKSVTKAGFHVNDKLPDGWEAATICKRAPKVYACKQMTSSWRTSIVADEKIGGSSVVQELWVFVYDDATTATKAIESLEGNDFEFQMGPFAKQPYSLFACDDKVFAIQSRFRWHTPHKKLRRHVEGALRGKCGEAKPATR